MAEDERYFADVVVQIASVQAALRGVSRALCKATCVTVPRTIRNGSPEQASA